MWNELQATIRVQVSVRDWQPDMYRFWDLHHAIPRPTSGQRVWAQIHLNGVWQDMWFNRVWGQSYDPDHEGTWLKQKATRGFAAATGDRTFRVRYLVSSSN